MKRMENGRLVDMTADELAALEARRQRDAAKPVPPAKPSVEELLEEVLDPANTTLAAVRTKLAARLAARGG